MTTRSTSWGSMGAFLLGSTVKPIPGAVATRVFDAQVALLYRLTPPSLVFSTVAASIVYLMVMDFVRVPVLMGWYALLLTLNLIRMALAYTYLHRVSVAAETQKWARIFWCVTFASGALWGFCGTVLLPRGEPELEFALLGILGLIPGVGYSSLVAIRSVYMALFMPLAVPVIVLLLTTGRPIEVIYGAGGIAYLWMLYVTGKRGERDVVAGLVKRFENENLLVEVHKAYEKAALASYELTQEMAQRRIAQRQMQQALETAERANRAKSDFLATMSHEIRTPLNGVLGLNELLIDSELHPQQRVWAESTQVAGRHLLGIINDILDVSKIESGHLTLEAVDFNLSTVVDDVMLMFSQPAQAKGLEFSVGFTPPGVGLALRGDPLRLRQVLANLTGNAVKFTEVGGVFIFVTVRDSSDSEVGFSLSVEDTGVGIASEELSNVFERFAQADSSTTRRYGGTGLGLAISRRLIGLMGGTMSVVSELGRGAKFSVDLVLPRALSPLSLSPPNLQDTAEIQLMGTVLLVEDNPINQLMAKAMLKRLGLDVQVAINGIQAIERVKDFDFDLVLMDCQMPVMDGFEATRIIRQLPHGRGTDLPIVALTANTVLGIEQLCMDVGMNAFIGKPYTMVTLRTTLMRWLVRQPMPMLRAPVMAATHAASHSIHPDTLKTLRELDEFGGMGLARSVFLAYLESADVGLSQVKVAIETSDCGALGQLAHALKSSSANVGANDLSICYRELERLGRDGLIDDAHAVFEHVRREHEHAVSHINELLLEIQ